MLKMNSLLLLLSLSLFTFGEYVDSTMLLSVESEHLILYFMYSVPPTDTVEAIHSCFTFFAVSLDLIWSVTEVPSKSHLLVSSIPRTRPD